MDVRSRSFTLHAGGVVAVLGCLIALDLILAVLAASPEKVDWTLPGFGSTGATISVLSIGLWVLTYILVPALIFALGYRYGTTSSAVARMR